MAMEQIIRKECEDGIAIANINMETAAAEGNEEEVELWRGRREAFSEILDLILTNMLIRMLTDGEG